MTDRLERMRALVAGTGGPTVGPCEPNPPSARMDQLACCLRGTYESPRGGFLVIRRSYPATDAYGWRRLGAYPETSEAALDVLAGTPPPGAAAEAAGPVVTMDLETTGLRGGAGTVAFLIGLGWRTAETYETCQHLLVNLAAERAMLTAAASTLARVHTLLTFNGKAFDLPVAETRWIVHRLQSPFGQRRHVDLLHPARRLWAAPDGRLLRLERDVLGFRRVDDVPGAEIPGRFVAFLRGADPRWLEPVLEHNRLDLVSLGLLAGLACEVVRTGVSGATDAVQSVGLGRLYERSGRVEEAHACYRRAAASPRGTQGRADALRWLARADRRLERHAEAAHAWRQLLDETLVPPALSHEANIALAVHHEHRDRNLQAAWQFASAALATASSPSGRHAVEHRLRRLDRKMSGQTSGSDLRSSQSWAGGGAAMMRSSRRAASSDAQLAVPLGWRRSPGRTSW